MPPWASSNLPGLRRWAPGEGALLVTEQLGLQQVAGQGSAVDLMNGLSRRSRDVVDGPGDHLLAGAALTLEEDGGIGVGGPPDYVLHDSHALAVPEEEVEVQSGLADRRAAALGRQQGGCVALGHGRLEGFLQGPCGNGLHQEVVGAAPHALDHEVGVTRARQDEQRHVGVLQLDLSRQVQAVVEVIDVEDHDLGMKTGEEVQPLGCGTGLQGGIVRPHNRRDQRRPALRACVNDQDRARTHEREGTRGLDEPAAGPDTGSRWYPCEYLWWMTIPRSPR